MVMTNAKKELLEEMGKKQVEFVRIYHGDSKVIEGELEDVLPLLDFEYDSGYGGQYLHGYIWYKDGTWSERREYDGLEWWEHKERPPIDVKIYT